MKIKKNGKVINLTESDLRRIVKKVIKEQDEAPEGGKSQWKFTVQSAAPNVNPFKSVVLIGKVEQKDPKTGKKGEPYYTVSTKKEGGEVVYAGNVNKDGSFNKKHVLIYNLGGYTTGKYTGPSTTVTKTLTKGFKDAIGLDINFQTVK